MFDLERKLRATKARNLAFFREGQATSSSSSSSSSSSCCCVVVVVALVVVIVIPVALTVVLTLLVEVLLVYLCVQTLRSPLRLLAPTRVKNITPPKRT